MGLCAMKNGHSHLHPLTSALTRLLDTSLAKEVMFLVALACLFVSLSVCKKHYSKSHKRIDMKFHEKVQGGKMKN